MLAVPALVVPAALGVARSCTCNWGMAGVQAVQPATIKLRNSSIHPVIDFDWTELIDCRLEW